MTKTAGEFFRTPDGLLLCPVNNTKESEGGKKRGKDGKQKGKRKKKVNAGLSCYESWWTWCENRAGIKK